MVPIFVRSTGAHTRHNLSKDELWWINDSGLPEKCTISYCLLIITQLGLRLWLRLVLVLICNITTANRLSYVVSLDYTNMIRCTFQVDSL